MKRIILFVIICTLGSAFFAETVYCLPWPPDMDIYYIKFNYESGSTYDALNIRKNYSTDVTVPEWQLSVRNEKIAYIKGQSGRKIKIKIWIDRTTIEGVRAYAESVTGPGIGDVNAKWVYFNNSNYSNETLMTTDGTVASSVGQRGFTWRWYVSDIDDFIIEEPILVGDTGIHYYYALLGTPQSPMTEPWTEVLDLACNWAYGETNESGALSDLTYWSYVEFGKDHDYDGTRTHANLVTLNLTNFFNDDWADCRDMSAVVHVFTRAIGGTTTQVRQIWGPFDYKPILPIGWTYWTDEDTLSDTWSFHQVTWKSNVYDACLKLKKSNPRIPINENITNPYKTDLYDSGTWDTSSPAFDYQTVR